MERYRDSIKTSTIIERGTEGESAKNKSQIVISINLKFELEFLCYKMQCMFFRKGIINTKCDMEKKNRNRYWQCEKPTVEFSDCESFIFNQNEALLAKRTIEWQLACTK